MEVGKKLPNKGRDRKGIFYTNIRLTDYANELVDKQYNFSNFK